MKRKRIASHFYTDRIRLFSPASDTLYAKGQYRTKLTKDDLPEYFYCAHWYGKLAYLDTKHVKQLVFRPCYSFDDHLYKDDSLYISYSEEIREYASDNGHFRYMLGYDFLLWGWEIVKFVYAVSQNSDYDTMPVRKQICDKHDWFAERNPDRCSVDVRKYFASGSWD